MTARRRFALSAAAVVVLSSLGTSALAQTNAGDYPKASIRFVVPASPGGPSDTVARMLADKLTPKLGQTVLVENRPGANQTLGTAYVANAAADGYTMLVTTSTPIVIAPFTTKNLPYDVERDLTVVNYIGTTPMLLLANEKVQASSVKDLVELAKAGQISYGTSGVGSSPYLLGEYLSRQLGITMNHIPYKGVAPIITDLLGGHIDLGVVDVGSPAPFIKSGQLKALAISGKSRTQVLPDVQTFPEQGIEGMELFSPWWGLFAPAGTPSEIVNRISDEVVAIVNSEEFSNRLKELGGNPAGLNAEDSRRAMARELEQWKKLIAELDGVPLQ